MRWRRLLIVAAAAAIGVVIAVIAIEIWVRIQWDDTKGTPGFFLTDATRGQRLAPGYKGWFAGVPVQINSLGFRDRREYSFEKPPNTFRIIVLGDSVTFGHGTLDDTTYPYLLEQRLRGWRPDLNWEVWNLGVPGYNTRQELTYLREIAPRARPDVVVVGFYLNDFTGDNGPAPPSSMVRRATAETLRVVQRHLYSYEFYKRAYLTARWRLLTSETDRLRIEHLATEQQLLGASGSAVDAPEQRLTEPQRVNQDEDDFGCAAPTTDAANNPTTVAAQLKRRDPAFQDWFGAVEEFQALHRARQQRIVFFINMAPVVCRGLDRFFDGGRLADDAALLEVLGKDTPAVSSTRAFLKYRPSQMPAAGEHAVGNSNAVKADVLFTYLRDHVLPPIIPAVLAQ